MKIFYNFERKKIQILLFIFSTISHLSFSSKINPIPKGNGIKNSKYSHKSSDNLFFIFEHFRHGARTTCEGKIINNTDILGGEWEDIGSLTKIGKNQLYNLGSRNKLRYKNFINNEYDPKEIKIFSTNYRRTIESAQSQLLGFYNNISFNNMSNNDIIGEEKINFKINNIIPPVNLYEYAKDGLYERLFMEKFSCPLFKNNIDKNKHKIYYFETLNRIRNNFNKKYNKIISDEFRINNTDCHGGMYNFCDAFVSNYYDDNNRKKLNLLEKKYKSFYLRDIINICYDYHKEYFFKIEGEKFAKINGILSMSKTFQKITNIMKDKIKNGNNNYLNTDSPKFLLYSGHDDTLTQMQMFLKVCFGIEYEWIPFASTQLFELRKYGNKFYVEIYYNDRLKLNMTFNNFNNQIQKNIMNEKEIYKKCYSFKNSSHFLLIMWLALICIIIFILFISIKLYFYCDEKHINKYSKTIIFV